MFKILVVEDNDNLRYLIVENLVKAKFDVTESQNWTLVWTSNLKAAVKFCCVCFGECMQQYFHV